MSHVSVSYTHLVEYIIYEYPVTSEPDSAEPTTAYPEPENPETDDPFSENPPELNKDINKKRNNQETTQASIDSIHSEPPKRIEDEEIWREIITENLESDYVREQSVVDAGIIDDIVELMIETVCSTREYIRVGKEMCIRDSIIYGDSSFVIYFEVQGFCGAICTKCRVLPHFLRRPISKLLAGIILPTTSFHHTLSLFH